MIASLHQPNNISTPQRVLIIGAGINGCGLFRDLCLQGVDCVLVDRGDICEGAIAAASRLIHGGIKYLERGLFGLARESCLERNRLLRNAPHYVKPLETLIPIRSWFGGLLASVRRFMGFQAKFTDRGSIITAIGLRLYDFYSRAKQALPQHTFFGGRKLHQEMPLLDRSIIAGGLYYEGQVTHAERLGLELVLDGLQANMSSSIALYSSVSRSASGELQLTHRLTGELCTIQATYLVNAGGAWIDDINHNLGLKTHYMAGTKGSHLIIDHPELLNALNNRMIYFGTADGRVNLAYPFFNHVLISATDLSIAHPDKAFCSDDEIEYLIGAVQEVFPTIRLERRHIIFTYCGVRPLPRRADTRNGDVSREHQIKQDILPDTTLPILAMMGGKWTTFRAFAEKVAHVVLSHLGHTRICKTEQEAIGGGRNYPRTEAARESWIIDSAELHRSTPQRIAELFDRYGTRAEQIAKLERDWGFEPLKSIDSYSRAEIVYLCRSEHVHRLSDIVLRRTEMAMAGQINLSALREIADLVSSELAWDQVRTESEIDNTIQEMQRRRVRLAA